MVLQKFLILKLLTLLTAWLGNNKDLWFKTNTTNC